MNTYRDKGMRLFRRESKEKQAFIYAGDDVAFGISHVGARENNEDSFPTLKLSDAYLLAVADGFGEHTTGKMASKIAIEALKEVFEREYRLKKSEGEIVRLLRKAHELAHSRIVKNATGERKSMGRRLHQPLLGEEEL